VKAIRVHQFGGPEVLQLEEVPDLQPGPGQVVVRVHAAGVNPVEAYIRTGTYASKPSLPYTPGSDAGGVVLKVAPDVKRVQTGDRVYVTNSRTGTYAEQTVCEESKVHPIPEDVSFEQGAAMGIPYATAYRGLFLRAQAQPAEIVLVHGASGGVGTGAVQLAHAAGMKVIGTAGSEQGMELVKKHGAEHVLNHTSPGYLDELKQLTGNRGVDVILEMLANKNLANDLQVLAKKGRVAVIGNRGTIEINPREAMMREADIRGVTLMNTSEEEYREIHAALCAGLETGALRPVIGEKIPLAEAKRAHEEIMTRSGALGKVVLMA
jgi:NADPH:quinone reductase